MKLKNFLANKSQTEFEVVRTEMEVTESNGEKIAVLHLKKPLSIVQGSMTVSDEATGSSERLEAYDVEVVRMHERDFDAEGIDINEDGTGFVKTNLRLDVSNRGDVWLTSKSFNAFRREKAGERASTRRSGIVTKMQERKASKALGGVNVEGKPEAVANETV